MKAKVTDHAKEAEEKFKVKGLTIITTYDVYNMLVSAIEGGSNYWYMFQEKASDLIDSTTEDLKGEPFVDRLLTSIQRGNSIEVHFYEDDDELLGTLTAESWAKAEKLMIEKHRSHLGNILREDDDAITADVFFQLAVMGDVVYG